MCIYRDKQTSYEGGRHSIVREGLSRFLEDTVDVASGSNGHKLLHAWIDLSVVNAEGI